MCLRGTAYISKNNYPQSNGRQTQASERLQKLGLWRSRMSYYKAYLRCNGLLPGNEIGTFSVKLR